MSFSSTRRGSLPFTLSSRHATPGPSSSGVGASAVCSPHKTPSPGSTPITVHRLPTTSPPSERLRRLAPKPVMIPPTPPIPLELGGALRRGSKPKVGLKEARKVRDKADGVEEDGAMHRHMRAMASMRREGEGEEGVGLGISGLTFGVRTPTGDEKEQTLEVRGRDGEDSDLDDFVFAPMLGEPTYDPGRASRENSYISYEETRDASFSTTSSFGFDTFGSPGKSCEGIGAPGLEPYEYRIASPRSVDARRRAPDVPEEVLSPRQSNSLGGPLLSAQSHGASSINARGPMSGSSGTGSDQLDSFFLDMRPAARQGDELLSPRAYLANHIPRPVLVQFRDVFGGGDTVAPHLPVVSAPGGPDDAYCFPPRASRMQREDTDASGVSDPNVSASSVHMDRNAPLAASFTETFGIGQSRPAAPTAPAELNGAQQVTAEIDILERPSMELDSLRAPSRADSASSFSFSAYMRSENGDADADSIKPRYSEEQVRARSLSLHRRPRYVDRLVPGLTYEDSPAVEELVTPETRTVRLDSDASSFIAPGTYAPVGHHNGLGLGLVTDDPPSPTPRSGRSLTTAKAKHARSTAGGSAGPGTGSLRITFDRPSTSSVGATPVGSQGADGERAPVRMQRPTTAAVQTAPLPRHHKSFPNLAKRPFTAPYHTQSFERSLVGPTSRLQEPVLASSASHASLTPSGRTTPSRQDKDKIKSKGRAKPDPLSARSVAEAQQAKEGKPFEAFSIDGFGAGVKDSRWKGNLKADVEIGGLMVGRYTTINLWADQQARESISTLYPVRLHTPVRAQQLDTEMTGRPPVVSSRKGRKDKDAQSPVVNPEDAFYKDGCVEFGMDPRGRDKWMFKFGNHDGMPKLNRLTVNGSQNLDYLSRHISLLIREPGIYTARGSERDGAEWRMRYMVNKGPPCLRPEDRCIVIMAFYVNGPFLRGVHASKVGLATSFAKSFKPDIIAIKWSTPDLIQASQVPTVPEIQLDPVYDEPPATLHIATPPSSAGISAHSSGTYNDTQRTPMSRGALPKRSISIKRPARAVVDPVTPQRQSQSGSSPSPSGNDRRPTTASPSIQPGTSARVAGSPNSIAAASSATNAKESLMITVRKRAATVWSRPSTGIAAVSPPSVPSPALSPSPSDVSIAAFGFSPPPVPPNSAASSASFGSTIGNILKGKRSLANLKRLPELGMTPATPSMPPLYGSTIDGPNRAPLSAKSANLAGARSALVPSASERTALHASAGQVMRHNRTFSANAAPYAHHGTAAIRSSDDARDSPSAWTHTLKGGSAEVNCEHYVAAHRHTPDKSRPPVSGAHRGLTPIYNSRRRPSTANDAQPFTPRSMLDARVLNKGHDPEDVMRIQDASGASASARSASPYGRQRF